MLSLPKFTKRQIQAIGASTHEITRWCLVRRADLIARLGMSVRKRPTPTVSPSIASRGFTVPLVGNDSPIITRVKNWQIVPKLAEATAEAGFDGAISALEFCQ
ncbi:hypothetical protein J4727_17655 [Providencia rettgeri]|uniref:Uncharacterized protein n=1 Tax=Providencia rettgeri TaxID=587 RepID=A0A939NBD4_PRORE|nr:hypothetical protein [Providencia rettgeri]